MRLHPAIAPTANAHWIGIHIQLHRGQSRLGFIGEAKLTANDKKPICLPTAARGASIIYQIGDQVVHPGHGGCTIQSLCQRERNGETTLYFVLDPQCNPQTTIYLPVESIEQICERKIVSAEQADQILAYLRSVDVDWVSDHKQRKQEYEATLKEGNLIMIAKMIKELVVREQETLLNQCDKDMLPKARRRLFSEIALAKGIDFEQAVELGNRAMA